jgi:hypothetical protein
VPPVVSQIQRCTASGPPPVTCAASPTGSPAHTHGCAISSASITTSDCTGTASSPRIACSSALVVGTGASPGRSPGGPAGVSPGTGGEPVPSRPGAALPGASGPRLRCQTNSVTISSASAAAARPQIRLRRFVLSIAFMAHAPDARPDQNPKSFRCGR